MSIPRIDSNGEFYRNESEQRRTGEKSNAIFPPKCQTVYKDTQWDRRRRTAFSDEPTAMIHILLLFSSLLLLLLLLRNRCYGGTVRKTITIRPKEIL